MVWSDGGVKSAVRMKPGIKWKRRTSSSKSLFAGSVKNSMSAGSRLAKAAFVGIQAVKGPAQRKISLKPASSTSSTKVVRSSLSAIIKILGSQSAPSNCKRRWLGSSVELPKVYISQMAGT
jgi:hypothetical protein